MGFSAKSQPGLALPPAPSAVPASPGVAAGPGPVAPQGTRVLTVVNGYRVPATIIKVWPSTKEVRGDNRIPKGQVVHPGQNLRVLLPQGAACLWDVGAEFDNEATQGVEADICADPTVTLTGPEHGKAWSTGTGFFISKNGHVLTNHHVVYGCASVRIDRDGESDLPLQLIREDTKRDLAILQETGVVISPLEFRPLARRLRKGNSVLAIGYPLPGVLTTTPKPAPGIVSDVTEDRFQMTTPINPGNSGGPVFDESGLVIGIAVSGLTEAQGVTFAVKTGAAQQLAQSVGVELTFSDSTANLPFPDIEERVEGRVLLLKCYN